MTIAELAQLAPFIEFEEWGRLEVPCSGPLHPVGKWGHVPEQPASWRVVAPCKFRFEACDGWVASRYRYVLFACPCGGTHLEAELLVSSL